LPPAAVVSVEDRPEDFAGEPPRAVDLEGLRRKIAN
jgi:hypothetical protein